ncbi:hypothetical protein [Halomonas sp. KHS3]|uniref:hypothetical protein n=1 Tax=Halomonas sp. KHS3 TaxID=866350 RepID=UPI00059B18CE|nr:hypothetical protein [Halomonas sp. KHS3]KIN13893.1 hypothetical protein RO22_17840 [Halomonas sp. KHS3]
MSSYVLNDICEFSEIDIHEHSFANFNPGDSSRLKVSTSPEYIVFRAFLGGISFVKADEERVDFDKNYYLIEPQVQSLDSAIFWEEVENVLSPLAFDEPMFLGSFEGRYLENKKFYESFLLEVSYSISASKKNNFVESFLHLYRALEHMCYALPLLYLKRADGYEKTYDEFKSFFGDEKKQSELGFGKKFIKKIMDTNVYSANFRLDFSQQPEQHFKALRKIFHNDDDFVFDDDLMYVDVCFGRIYDLIVKVRNMYFHYLYSKNYSLGGNEIVLPNKFFETFADVGLCFLANFYLIAFTSKYE